VKVRAFLKVCDILYKDKGEDAYYLEVGEWCVDFFYATPSRLLSEEDKAFLKSMGVVEDPECPGGYVMPLGKDE
jgi:hypothetical protein